MAIVHKVEVGKLTTLVINKQNKVMFQQDGYFSGEIGDSYVYIEDGYTEPGYDEDGYNEALDVRMKTGSYYDYNWKRLSIASRKGKSDEYGYWAANGDRINIPGYKSEMDADDYDVFNSLRNGIVDKDNNIIVPMVKYPDSVTFDGKTIVPYSSKLLTTISYNKQWVTSIDGYVFSEPPHSNFVFYSTANMNEKADTTGLKALVAQAEAISKKYSTKGLPAAIADANSVIASENPRWIDINMAEIELMYEARSANGYLTGKW